MNQWRDEDAHLRRLWREHPAVPITIIVLCAVLLVVVVVDQMRDNRERREQDARDRDDAVAFAFSSYLFAVNHTYLDTDTAERLRSFSDSPPPAPGEPARPGGLADIKSRLCPADAPENGAALPYIPELPHDADEKLDGVVSSVEYGGTPPDTIARVTLTISLTGPSAPPRHARYTAYAVHSEQSPLWLVCPSAAEDF